MTDPRLPNPDLAARPTLGQRLVHAWWPAPPTIGLRERLRAATGAMLGLALAGLLGLLTAPAGTPLPFLIAPMGASAVLLFVLPASPMAQPWSILAGNLVSGAIGLACAHLLGPTLWATGSAMALSIVAMLALRCLHPPSGAMAVITTLGGPAVQAAGAGFLLWPVTLDGLVLVLAAIAWNTATGHPYPHPQRRAPAPTQDPPMERLGLASADLRAALREHGEVLDVSEDDLESLILRTERLAHRRRFGETRCEHVMTRAVVTVEFATPLAEAWALLRARDLTVLPVVDRARRVIGVLSREDFLHAIDAPPSPGLASALARRLSDLLRPTPGDHSDKPEVVGQLMTTPAVTVRASLPLVDLVPSLAGAGHRHLPVVGDDEKLAGLVAPADVIAALYETGLAGAGGASV